MADTGLDKEQLDIDIKKWNLVLSKIAAGLFFATIFIEITISVIMYFQGLIDQEIPVYLAKYVIRPISISSLIMLIGYVLIWQTKTPNNKYRIYILMITLMFSNLVFVHNVFMVAFFLFSIPISLTVILQDKVLLFWTTLLSEGSVLVTALYSVIYSSGASDSELYIPSVIIITVILFASSIIARISIDVLINKNAIITQALEDAKAADKSKSLFLSNMSHEIRTPLNAILGMDEMIVRETNEGQIRDYALDIQSSGRSLLGIINDVLDFSKIEAGKLSLIPTEYDTGTIINDLINTISSRAVEKGLTFIPDISPDLPYTLYGDEIRIRQVALNLLTNAVKYTDTGSIKMSVSSKKQDDEHTLLCFTVKDTGKGMKKEDMDRLFAPFERIDEKNNRSIEGTGLGMSITKSLLDMMDSELKVDSVWGEGSTFYFEILQEIRNANALGDITEVRKKTKEEAPKYKESFTAPDVRVLVVDDMAINLKVIKSLLKKTQVKTDVALSGKECIELASRNKYDLIFIDHMMPEMDGIETLKHIENDENSLNKDVPKIALTANAISGSREFYLQEGFSEYLSKPVNHIKLEQLMLHMLPEELIKGSE